MILLAIIVGLISSYYLAVIYMRQFMTIFYHTPFRFWRPYLALYDRLESRYSYELLGSEKRFKSHRAFLATYRALRPYAAGHFRRLWDGYARRIGLVYGAVFVVSLGLFWSVYWAFIGPFLIVQGMTFAHLYFVKQYRADFFASLVLSLILSKHS